MSYIFYYPDALFQGYEKYLFSQIHLEHFSQTGLRGYLGKTVLTFGPVARLSKSLSNNNDNIFSYKIKVDSHKVCKHKYLFHFLGYLYLFGTPLKTSHSFLIGVTQTYFYRIKTILFQLVF